MSCAVYSVSQWGHKKTFFARDTMDEDFERRRELRRQKREEMQREAEK